MTCCLSLLVACMAGHVGSAVSSISNGGASAVIYSSGTCDKFFMAAPRRILKARNADNNFMSMATTTAMYCALGS